MGMFQNPEKFTDHYQEGQVFNLEDAKMGNAIKTEYGMSSPALLKIDGTWYSLFGVGVKNQVERMEPGDLPARVSLERVDTKSGNQVKILVPEGQEKPSEDDIPF